MSRLITRREALRAGVASSGAAAAGALLSSSLISHALAAAPTCGSLGDIEHVVILIQENRSFDHYFGSYRGARGFADPNVPRLSDSSGLSIFAQPGYPGGFKGNHLYPFHLDSYNNGECTNDINHRLYAMSAWLDPAGTHGGPILSTSSTRLDRYATLSWTTMPEQLQARGISWKVYGSGDGNYGDNVLPYFKQYWSNPTLTANALTPSYPGTFQADVAAGTLPQVSWVLAPLIASEHPPAPEIYGEVVAAQVLNTLVSNPAIWSKTALFITYDENGGFFDHVPPPVAPANTPGEYLTANPLPSDASGTAGPTGLGFRVPMLVVSPFARGGFVASHPFDHTSTLRFLETRFGAEVPNLSTWRRSATGDLTSAFNFAAVNRSVPPLPQPSAADNRITMSSCATSAPLSLVTDSTTTLKQLEETLVSPYPVKVNSAPPPQERGAPKRPSGPVACAR
jgi:phospholipase C